VLLLLVLIPGFGGQSYGAARWLTLGPLSFQPSEFAKLSVVLYLAAWIGRVGGDINKLTFGTIPFALIVALSAGLILKEDLGTTVVLCLTAASMAFIAGANVLHGLAGAIAACVLIANFALHGYRAERIETFFNPWADPSGLGWHTTQVLLALGSGGLAGLGLGASRQKHGYVPNAHTDSIYAIVGEELGFIGATVVLVLFLVIAWRGLTIAASARDPLGRSLAAGGTLLIIWQGLLNMAVTTHLVPNTGVPLPFLSYGGSSMVVSLAAVGLILSVGRGLDSAENGVRALVPSTVSRDPAPPQRWSPPPRRDSHRSSPRQQPKVARRRHTRGPIGRYL
jgi:cell division protein FtsW